MKMSAARISYAFPAIFGIIGGFILLLITKHGIGIMVDSVTYIGGAINLLSGNGYSDYALSANSEIIPITKHPPLFSVVLAFLGLLNITPVVGARLINSFLFGANILLVGFIVNRETSGSIWLSMLASSLILTSNTMLSMHSSALTEPMFIFLSIIGLYLLCLYIDNYKTLFLIFAAFFVTMSLLTRYAGVALIISGIIGILLLGKGNWHKNILDSLILFIISILPISIWVIRNKYFYSDSVGRQFVYHPAGQEHIKASISIFSRYLFTFDNKSIYISQILLVALCVILLIATFHMIKDSYKDNAVNNLRTLFPTIPSIYFIYIITYLLFILFSKSFYDAYIPFDNRILSPLFIPFIVVLLYIIYRILSYYNYKVFLRCILYASCILLGALYIEEGTIWALNAQKDGMGYSSIFWKNSDTLNYIKIAPSERIYSNACDAIYILTGKICYRLPPKYDRTSLEINKRYLGEIALIKTQLENKSAVLCWLDNLSWRKYLPSEEELIKELHLKVIQKFNDGKIYGIGD
jgi:hypothetical protein